MRKISAIVCAVLAGSLGFSTLASAQDGDHRGGERYEHRGYEHREFRGDRDAHERYENRAWAGPRYEHRHEAPRYYGYNHPHFYRGGFLPYEYRQPAYYIDYRSYPGLYAPPYGYQWVQVGGDLMLVALASGLIANMLTY